MARLQILELPEGSNDDRPPYVLVIDEHVPQRYILGPDQPEPVDQFERITEKIGARAVLVFEETIDIPGNDVPLDPDGYPVKMRIEPDFETFREQVQDEIRKTQGELARAINREPVSDRIDIARDMHRLAKWRDDLSGALGMDHTGNWAELIEAATGMRKQRDTQADQDGALRTTLCNALVISMDSNWDQIIEEVRERQRTVAHLYRRLDGENNTQPGTDA